MAARKLAVPVKRNTVKTTVTMPTELKTKIDLQATKLGFSYNRYMVMLVSNKLRNATDLQPIVMELAQLRTAVEKGAKVLPEEVQERSEAICRLLESFVVKTIRPKG